ncbi:sialate O-acetylesterase [Pontiellaceae bacterium B1224]|nr:sialate O-acetylesterase [Pontiellaceae bacterium B1224]
MKKATFLVFTLLLVAGSVVADVRMGTLFSDGMVIQRDTLAPVWGWAEPGEKIEVSTSWGAKSAAKAGADGAWQVLLKTPAAGLGHTITVAGANSITVEDVASGDVWLCGGQSNMDFNMQGISRNAREPEYQPVADYVRTEMQSARDPMLRHIEVKQTTSPFEKKYDFTGQWVSVSPETNPNITCTGYFFGRELRKNLPDVPIGLLECAWGGTRVQPWISKATYLADPEKAAYFKGEQEALKMRLEAWSAEEAKDQYEAALAKWTAAGKKGSKPRMKADPSNDKQHPATLHNGMVSAVVPFAMKGVIWYQGESNAGYMRAEYQDYFSTLIRSWRTEWNRGDFPFYYVQLAAYKAPNDEPLDDNGWAEICDQQRRCLKQPNTGMAVTTDIGEAKDIHPRNKVDVGRRLAFWALEKDYNIDLPAHSGPLYQSHSVEGNKFLITFSETGSGLMVGDKHGLDATVAVDEPLARFQITGSDRNWKWADVKIVSENSIEVSHPDISSPIAVRYAWSENPAGANLYNKEGLPASMFTTE